MGEIKLKDLKEILPIISNLYMKTDQIQEELRRIDQLIGEMVDEMEVSELADEALTDTAQQDVDISMEVNDDLTEGQKHVRDFEEKRAEKYGWGKYGEKKGKDGIPIGETGLPEPMLDIF